MDHSSDFSPAAQGRIASLDFFRGFTMFLLVGEATHLYDVLRDPALNGTFLSMIGWQLEHHPWNGLRFWDLVQPFFMFIVGAAMPFSFAKRRDRGDTWSRTLLHALRRSAMLFLFGWGLYCIGPGRITFELWNVLTQLSFTYLVAFLLMRKSWPTQVIFSFAMILASELLYRFWPVAGFNHPFTPDQGFGAWMDLRLMGKLSEGHWVAFNAVPTTAHTMWGVLAGQFLQSDRLPLRKFRVLIAVGFCGVIAGTVLGLWTPIIKRICTSSFVIVTGGWCLVVLAVSYWLIDIRGIRKWSLFFNIVGMNSLFIYVFTHTGGAEWFRRIARPFTFGLFSWTGELGAKAVTGVAVWAMLWSLCCLLYRKRIFLKM